jgi:hypothetical protein
MRFAIVTGTMGAGALQATAADAAVSILPTQPGQVARASLSSISDAVKLASVTSPTSGICVSAVASVAGTVNRSTVIVESTDQGPLGPFKPMTITLRTGDTVCHKPWWIGKPIKFTYASRLDNSTIVNGKPVQAPLDVIEVSTTA